MRITKRGLGYFFTSIALSLTWGSLLLAQNPRQSIDDLLSAHHAWNIAPTSVEITGTSTRRGAKVPVKITATRDEEVLIEISGEKQVATRSRNFTDDGKTIAYALTPAGFRQLDVTGVFFVAQMALRPIQVATPETLKDDAGKLLRVSDNRSQKFSSQVRVDDKADIFVDKSGLLTGISRSFYDNVPRFRYILTTAFSDYRDTAGVLLPYRIEIYVSGNKIETIDVTAYQFDVPVSSSFFLPRRQSK